MYYNNNFPESFFKKGHSTLTWGTVLLGSVLFFLAIFIFAYPALIAYFIAAIILFAGLLYTCNCLETLAISKRNQQT